MADIASARQKVNDIETSNDAPVTEDLFLKISANVNDYLDKVWQKVEFTSSGSWTCPSGVTMVGLFGCGGGGGGSGYVGAMGGSGAPLGVKLVTVVPATVYSITIGGGGSGGTDAGHGNNGSDTTFGALATFKGGRGGISYQADDVFNYIWMTQENLLKRAPIGTLGGFYFNTLAGHTYGQDSAEYQGGVTYGGSQGGGGGGAGPFGNGADGYPYSWWLGQAAAANTGAGGSGAGISASGQAGGSGGSGKLVLFYWGNT